MSVNSQMRAWAFRKVSRSEGERVHPIEIKAGTFSERAYVGAQGAVQGVGVETSVIVSQQGRTQIRASVVSGAERLLLQKREVGLKPYS